MTNEELRAFTFNMIETLIQKKCYIKGYGKMFRVCDHTHSPVINLTRQQFEILRINQIVQAKDLIWVIIVIANPFSNGKDIKLPKKEYNEAA